MPQMAPMHWLTLFMIFTLIFILFFILNFYNIIYPSPKTQQTKKISSINWKW